MPVENGCRLTSQYSTARNLRGSTKPHWGADFGGPSPAQDHDRFPVFAVSDGVVTRATGVPLPHRSGPALTIDHLDGGTTYYGHVRDVLVKVGDRVKRGQRIATMWHTGIPRSWGIHVHVERWTKTGDPSSHVDPLPYLEKHGWVIENGRIVDKAAIQLASIEKAKDEELTPEQVQEIKEYMAFQVKEGIQWATLGYNGDHAMKVSNDIRVASQAAYREIVDVRREMIRLAGVVTGLETALSNTGADYGLLVDEIHRAVKANMPKEITVPLNTDESMVS